MNGRERRPIPVGVLDDRDFEYTWTASMLHFLPIGLSMISRVRSALKWLRHHPWRSVAVVLCLGFLIANGLAIQHARAMLYFVRGGTQTASPEKLSTLEKVGVLITGVRVPRPENDRTPRDVGLEFRTERIHLDSTVVLEAWVIPVIASNGVVVLHHGYAGSKSDLIPEAKEIFERGYTVWLVDFRGSGGSSESSTTIGFKEAEDVAAVLRHVRKSSDDQPVILYGRSMGAAAILRAMHVHQSQPDAVILESVFDRLQTTVGNRFHQMGLPTFPAANFLMFWGGVCAGFRGHEHNPVDYAPSCRWPTLLLHGELDSNAKVEEGKHVQSRLGDGASEFVAFSGAGHAPTFNADPERWRAAVSRLLKRVSADR